MASSLQRELSSLPLPSQQRVKLLEAGFSTVADVLELKPTELSKEIKISAEEALEIIQVVRCGGVVDKIQSESLASTSASQHVSSVSTLGAEVTKAMVAGSGRARTVLDMLQDDRIQQSIITFSEQLDTILGGGVPLTKITEFCGAPGVGKTQISMQLAVDVQIPECFGGLEGQAIYIDTEGSFMVERVAEIAKATVEHCHNIARLEASQEQMEKLQTFTLLSILGGITYFRCHDHIELIALVHQLPGLLLTRPQVKLLVVDSIAFPFRHDFDDLALRTRLLNGMAQSLITMASEKKLAVVLINQMTTKITPGDYSGRQSHLVPALGESWGHASTIRVILYWRQRQRHALLYKSPSQREAAVPYQVTTGGIRDVSSSAPASQQEDPSPATSDLDLHTDHAGHRKRPRMDS